MENKRYNFIFENRIDNDNDIKNILNNISDIEQIKNIINKNLNNSKCLLNDIDNISDIENYNKENGYSYDSNFLENENKIDISFKNIDYYNKNDIMIGNYSDNYHYPIILCNIPKKTFFIDYLDNIENIIDNIVQYLKNNITFKKHLILLSEIEQFLNLGFNENVYCNYSYNFNDFEQYPKFFKMDLSKFENKPKNIYKVLKHGYLKILNCLYKIIEQNVL